ncbi:MAG TPA: hypothetical protein VK636_10060 [Gemmatimonadaceae bacterium]|nr:hypothetical protein [Gemmatimonadaceae bacterium]
MTDELRVDGSVTFYRLHDVGYAIALDQAATLLGDRTTGRAVPGRTEARAIQIRNPPLVVSLGSHEITVNGATHRGLFSAHVFDFAVCSLQLRIAAPAGLTWSAFAELGAALEASPALSGAFDRALADLLVAITPAVERPERARVHEDYKVYRIDRVHRGDAKAAGSVAELVSDEQLLSLLFDERRTVSAAARRELIPYRFSYYEDDLAALSWESAVIVEPRSEDRDVEYVLEFANAQLLELRIFDSQLDAELPSLYDRIAFARTKRRPRLAGRFRTVLADLQTRVADITETVERVENALRVTNDVYLARIYAAALELFREKDWRRGVERKLETLRGTYGMLSAESQAARAELLEIAIVVLIVAELVIALLH